MPRRTLGPIFGLLAACLVVSARPAAAQFSISGTVTDTLGLPVPAADVLLFDDLGTPIGTLPILTDSMGFYVIAPLPPGAYGVAFEPRTVSSLLPRLVTPIVVAGDVILDVVVFPGHILSGVVRDSTGIGIFNIDLNVFDRRTRMKLSTPGDNSDSTGVYDVVVPTGEFDLEWRAVDPLLESWIPVKIRNVFIDADTTIDLTMVIGIFVSGTVLDASAAPVLNVNLDFFRAGTRIKIASPGDNTDSTGFYQVHIPLGAYDVRVKPPAANGLLGLETFGVPLFVDTTLAFVLAEPGLSLSGTVRDPLGAGVLAVDLNVADALTGARLFTPFDDTDSTGHYEIIVPPGTYDIEYRPLIGTLLAPVALAGVVVAGDTVIDVSVPDGVLFGGDVQDTSGVGVAGVDIDVKDPVTGAGLPLVGDNTDGGGAFAVVVPPGVYDVEVEPPKTLRLVAELLPGFALTADTTTVALSLMPGVSISGTVKDSLGLLLSNVDVDAVRLATGKTVFTPGDHTDPIGHYEIVVPRDAFDLTYRADSLSGVIDTLVLSNVAIDGDTVLDVTFLSTRSTGAAEGPPHARFRLRQNVPNPFNPTTSIRFELAREGRVSLAVYDVRGALIRALREGHLAAGPHEVVWDGRDARGRRVASGVYFYRLVTGRRALSRRMVLIK